MGNEMQNKFDQLVRKLIARITQRSSRRGLLSSVGKSLLTLLGFTIVSVQPFDRLMPEASAQTCTCDVDVDPTICGMWGHPCCDCGGNNSECPPDLSEGSGWTFCCSGTSYTYIDCCYIIPGQGPPTCGTLFCRNNPNQQPTWCPTDAPAGKFYRYGCTIIVSGGPC